MASVASSATYSNTRERSKYDSYFRKLERLDKLAATILDNLKRLAIPGTVIELRVPDLERIVDGSKYTLTRCYHYDNLQALAEEAARHEGKANMTTLPLGSTFMSMSTRCGGMRPARR